MKTIRIFERTIKVKSFYKRFPCKSKRQVTIIQDDKIAENHFENINNPRLRVKFVETFKTRSKKELQKYINSLGRTDVEKWIKSILNQAMEV